MWVYILSRHGRDHAILLPGNKGPISMPLNNWIVSISATTACGSPGKKIRRGGYCDPDHLSILQFTGKIRSMKFLNPKLGHVQCLIHFPDIFENSLPILPWAGSLFPSKRDCSYIERTPFFHQGWIEHVQDTGRRCNQYEHCPGAALANEAGIPYAPIALSTDYDSATRRKTVTWEEVLKVFEENVIHVTNLLIKVLPKIRVDNSASLLRGWL